MNRKQLRELVRTLADDLTPKFLWQDPFINQALDDAENEACRRARLIIDSTTPAVCRIALAANKPLYAVHPSVIYIRRVKLSTRPQPLGFARMLEMDALCDWEAETGDVEGWIPDHTTGNLRLYRIPDATAVPATANLTVVRTPLKGMKTDEDCPEIKPRYHYNLAHWALFRMYGVPDSDTFNPKAAAENLAMFEAEFGKRSSAQDESFIDANYDYGENIGLW